MEQKHAQISVCKVEFISNDHKIHPKVLKFCQEFYCKTTKPRIWYVIFRRNPSLMHTALSEYCKKLIWAHLQKNRFPYYILSITDKLYRLWAQKSAQNEQIERKSLNSYWTSVHKNNHKSVHEAYRIPGWEHHTEK